MFAKIRKFHSIWQLMLTERVRFLAAIASLVIASCFLYLVPMIPQMTLDVVLKDDPEGASKLAILMAKWLGGREFLAANLWVCGLIIALLAACAAFFTYLRGRWSAKASESIIRRLRDRIYDHLQHLQCRFFDDAQTGDLIQRASSDVETVRLFLATQVVEIGRASIMLLIPIPLMLMTSWRMTIASVILLPPIVAFSLVYFGRVRSAFKDMDEAEGRMTTTVQENLTGIRVVRAFARQDFERRKFAERNAEHRNLDYRLYRLFAFFWGLSDLLCLLQIAIVVCAGSYLIVQDLLMPGGFFFFLSAVTMFTFPVRHMGRILSDLGKALVALGRIEEILDEPEEAAEDVMAPGAPAALEGRIEFANVTFSHGNESPVLHDVSFEVPTGTTLAILGPSGSGKSTIINLLLRMYDFDEGEIRLDGRDLRSLDRKFVRSQMAIVMQEPFLFSKSIRENIRMGRRAAADEEMFEATSIASIHDSIVEFDEGYDTVVGERGATLSGGQRQRVALARALLQRPAVLILDDALSAVDTETESRILDALKQRRGKHTTIVIAHRLGTLMHADHILVLEHGRIVQHGTHRELMSQEGLYARLWGIQSAIDPEDREMVERARRGARVATKPQT